MAVKFEARSNGGYHQFTVSFPVEREDLALEWITARRSSHNVYEIPGQEVPETWTRVLDLLYPTCHHGMDGRACLDDEHHWGTCEQEMTWEV